jgi:hypothetical protein
MAPEIEHQMESYFQFKMVQHYLVYLKEVNESQDRLCQFVPLKEINLNK